MKITEKAINLNELTSVPSAPKEINTPIGNTLGVMLDRAVAQGPMRVLSGPSESGENGAVPANNHYPSDDAAIIARIKHTMRPGEKLMQWYARIGLGRAQILAMSAVEIAKFVQASEESARTEGTWKPHAVNIDFNAPRTLTEGARTTIIG